MNVYAAIHRVAGLEIGPVQRAPGDQTYYTRKITITGPDGTEHEIVLFSYKPESL